MRRLHADATFHNDRREYTNGSRAEAAAATSAERPRADLQEQLDDAAARCGGAGLKVAGALRQLEARGAELRGAARRIARLHFAAARRHFADALDAHHALLAAVRDQQRRLLQQQLLLGKAAALRYCTTPSVALEGDTP